MNGQLIIALLFVAVAAIFVLRSLWQALRHGGCATGCGKCSLPVEEVTAPGRISLSQVKSS